MKNITKIQATNRQISSFHFKKLMTKDFLTFYTNISDQQNILSMTMKISLFSNHTKKLIITLME